MDLTQAKLTREEWENIEIPVSPDEKQILLLIINGFNNVNIKSNENMSLFSFAKIEITPENENFLYQKYFSEWIQSILNKYGGGLNIKLTGCQSMAGVSIKKIKSADNIRIMNIDANIKQNIESVFEYTLISLCEKLLKHLQKRENKYAFYLYTLIHMRKQSIVHLNIHVCEFVDKLISVTSKYTEPSNIMENAYEFIEKNKYLLKYQDKALFNHQKLLFSIFKTETVSPKLVLYTAPTGTGKTLSPIGLAGHYRIIFVCVARHIGVALAKSAISMEKKVAFAFGCQSAADIRLHYFAAKDYTKNRKSGGIGKVDNSNGLKVEIMICDIQSYLTAMYYMLAFNKASDIITYWDEPTITMDYETHPLHTTIQRNWAENKIPNVVLSCATLPKEDEIGSVLQDFRSKFDGAEIRLIESHDCRKSIPLLNKDNYSVLPHNLYSNYEEMIRCVNYCSQNRTLLRYFDLAEIVRFIVYLHEEEIIDDAFGADEYYSGGIGDITMDSLKNYYLLLLKHIEPSRWVEVYSYIMNTRDKKFDSSRSFRKVKSMEVPSPVSSVLSRTISVSADLNRDAIKKSSGGILLTTADAYSLTDGPTIFLSEDVQKIGSFYIQQSNISPVVFQTIMARISKNGEFTEKIVRLENTLEAEQNKMGTNDENEEKKVDSERLSNSAKALLDEINKLRKEIKMVSLDPMYVPNTKSHQELWAPLGQISTSAFLPNIDEETTRYIMSLDIENNLKVLLLLGIGMFMDKPNIKYMEIMKRLADEQRLFIIIASSDYIYGTNYQFCHGFIGKDLKNMTQQKTIQAMGRIGRNNIQQSYTVRFRDDAMIKALFERPKENLEAVNMCALFCS
uniref:Helicase/UvrB N-terminal domain-containing protein n=1 Tax=viral metagenome TaxID=1070528 RepID=A0A6C0B7T5_9ZZZZ